MKAIKITKCFEECPYLRGPDHSKNHGESRFSCDEAMQWLSPGEEDTIPGWCPLEDNTQAQDIKKLEGQRDEIFAMLRKVYGQYRTQIDWDNHWNVNEFINQIEKEGLSDE